MADSSEKSKKIAGITWDEETIALHDLDRGTRMKIEEPNTPFAYHYDDEVSIADSTSKVKDITHNNQQLNSIPLKEQWDEFHDKLEKQKEHMERRRSTSSSEENCASPFSNSKFIQRRNDHYSKEHAAAKAWREGHKDSDDSDDEKEKII